MLLPSGLYREEFQSPHFTSHFEIPKALYQRLLECSRRRGRAAAFRLNAELENRRSRQIY